MIKPRAGLAALLFATALALCACSSGTAATGATGATPPTMPTTTTNATQFPVPLVPQPGCIGDRATGIGNSAGGGLLGWPVAVRQQALKLSVDMGQPATLTDANWAMLEPADRGGELDPEASAKLSAMLRDLRTANQAVGLLLTYAPTWVQPVDCTEASCLPAAGEHSDQAFGRFAATVTKLALKAGIPANRLAIVPGNEPNIDTFAKPRPDATRTAALTTAAYQAVKAINPHVTVVSPGITNTGDEFTLNYVKEFVAAGAQYDAFGYHPYPHTDDLTGPPTQALNLIPKIRALLPMVDGRQPAIWLTEVSYATASKAGGRFVSEAEQRQYLAEVIRYWAKDTKLGPLFVYQSVDEGKSVSDPAASEGHDEDTRGLSTLDGRRKPAGQLVARVNEILRAAGNDTGTIVKAAA